MSISKKIRFEVFKRDGFVCQYCGNTPPKVILEIDHINPKSKKGKDDINNLITACFNCNRGKGKESLKSIPKTLKQNLESLKEKELQLKKYNEFIRKIERRIQKDIQEVNDIYISYFENWRLSDNFCNSSLRNFLDKLPKFEVERAMHLACSKWVNKYGIDKWVGDKVIKYFCGICWNKIKENK